jgi:hypothetical protein
MSATGKLAVRHSLLALGLAAALGVASLTSIRSPSFGTATQSDFNIPMETQCVGRYLIDLPKGSKLIGSEGSARGALFSARAEQSQEEFLERVNKRWLELVARTTDSNGKPYVKSSQRKEILPNGFLLQFAHSVTRAPDAQGRNADWPIHKSEAYLWRDGMTYTFGEGQDEAIVRTMQELQTLRPEVIPAGSGFCGPASFFAGFAAAESVDVSFSLPTQPSLTLRVSMTTYPSSEALVSATPPKTSSLALPDGDDFKQLRHRDAKRDVAGIKGDEWIHGATERKSKSHYRTTVIANWFGPGDAGSSAKPAIHVQLSAAFVANEPPQPWGSIPKATSPDQVSNDSLAAYWSALLGSLRLRPGAV